MLGELKRDVFHTTYSFHKVEFYSYDYRKSINESRRVGANELVEGMRRKFGKFLIACR